jgi:hypothetical protein
MLKNTGKGMPEAKRGKSWSTSSSMCRFSYNSGGNDRIGIRRKSVV